MMFSIRIRFKLVYAVKAPPGYYQISLSFGKLCESLNIRTPLGLNEDNFDFPIVIKPKSYFSSTNKIYKPEVITNRKNLDFFLERKKHK